MWGVRGVLGWCALWERLRAQQSRLQPLPPRHIFARVYVWEGPRTGRIARVAGRVCGHVGVCGRAGVVYIPGWAARPRRAPFFKCHVPPRGRDNEVITYKTNSNTHSHRPKRKKEAAPRNSFSVTVWCERGISESERPSHHRVGPGQLHNAQTPA